jgi:hypothetical protein
MVSHKKALKESLVSGAITGVLVFGIVYALPSPIVSGLSAFVLTTGIAYLGMRGIL